MGMNISRRKRRSMVMESEVGNWPAGSLFVGCPRCRSQRVVQLATLPAIFEKQSLSAVIRKLRCSAPACGSRPNFVQLNGGPPDRYGREFSIVLIGIGASY